MDTQNYKVKINSSPEYVLTCVPGIGPATAQRIIAIRNNGVTITPEILEQIPYMKNKVSQGLLDLIDFSPCEMEPTANADMRYHSISPVSKHEVPAQERDVDPWARVKQEIMSDLEDDQTFFDERHLVPDANFESTPYTPASAKYEVARLQQFQKDMQDWVARHVPADTPREPLPQEDTNARPTLDRPVFSDTEAVMGSSQVVQRSVWDSEVDRMSRGSLPSRTRSLTGDRPHFSEFTSDRCPTPDSDITFFKGDYQSPERHPDGEVVNSQLKQSHDFYDKFLLDPAGSRQKSDFTDSHYLPQPDNKLSPVVSQHQSVAPTNYGQLSSMPFQDNTQLHDVLQDAVPVSQNIDQVSSQRSGSLATEQYQPSTAMLQPHVEAQQQQGQRVSVCQPPTHQTFKSTVDQQQHQSATVRFDSATPFANPSQPPPHQSSTSASSQQQHQLTSCRAEPTQKLGRSGQPTTSPFHSQTTQPPTVPTPAECRQPFINRRGTEQHQPGGTTGSHQRYDTSPTGCRHRYNTGTTGCRHRYNTGSTGRRETTYFSATATYCSASSPAPAAISTATPASATPGNSASTTGTPAAYFYITSIYGLWCRLPTTVFWFTTNTSGIPTTGAPTATD